MSTERLDPPRTADPAEIVRALRGVAERLVSHATELIDRADGMRAAEWLERDLADCEAFIRETAAIASFGLSAEGGRDLAEAKVARREMRRMREEMLRPYRRAAERWRGIRSRLDHALAKSRGREVRPERLAELLAAIEALDHELTRVERRTLMVARKQLELGSPPASTAARRLSGAGAEGAGVAPRTPAAPAASPRVPLPPPESIAGDPDPELLARYLPPPADLEFEPEDRGVLERLAERRYDAVEDYRLNQVAQHLSLLGGFEVLLAPPLLGGIEQHPFQLDTARHVMRAMRGRALLCDEVGLGKTIEAGLVLKEYVLRGLARRVLILTPPSLVSQWIEEMRDKFELEFATLDDPRFRREGPAAWESCDRVIASLHTAKSARHAEAITRIAYDLVIVDEAHHLRNRTSVSWKFVNQLKSKYLLLLTATPAQNDLDELFNLITLLSPGQLKSPAAFRREFVERNDPRRPRNRTKLRELLMDVMVRNTRSQVNLSLPPRRAATLRVALTPSEQALYDGVTGWVRDRYRRAPEDGGRRVTLQVLLTEAGSSAEAVRATLRAMRARLGAERAAEIDPVLELAAHVEESSKAEALIELLGGTAGGEKVLVFTQYLETQAHLERALERAGLAPVCFNGGMSASEKNAAITAFAHDRRVLISTDVGSEGRNLQFCHTIVNYDLPWNPMRIEQRVGRVHRIGQTEPVTIFNLAARGTIEDHVLEVLDSKIDMFELVVGEVGEILGNLDEEREFEDIVLDLWAGAESDEAARERFTALGDRLVGAQQRYFESKAYDAELFGQDFAAPE